MFPKAMAIQNCISGVLGFCATLLGSYVLSHIQNNGNMLFGIPVYGQQVLSAISLIIVLCCIVYDRVVVEKQDVMIQWVKNFQTEQSVFSLEVFSFAKMSLLSRK